MSTPIFDALMNKSHTGGNGGSNDLSDEHSEPANLAEAPEPINREALRERLDIARLAISEVIHLLDSE